MNAITEKIPDPLIFTDNAANKVKSLIEEEGNPDLKLRVFVSGGGCSGFQYGFTFEESVSDDDTSLNKGGVTLLVDPMSVNICWARKSITRRTWKAAVRYQAIRTQRQPAAAALLSLHSAGVN